MGTIFVDGNFVCGCFDGVYYICDKEFSTMVILGKVVPNVT